MKGGREEPFFPKQVSEELWKGKTRRAGLSRAERLLNALEAHSWRQVLPE